ncbi:hypothetical protein [Psychrobacillus antarcticus]|uniref:hypothetical protein n=1 Tax=Psychrobacillus antarcticus TaxID=2879115 RepID=UPI002407BE76|nr:hypothetical protein [Psychrobacillus antarcticus]
MIKQNIFTLKETTYSKPTELYSVVERCVICNQRHIHAAEEGNVSAHCIDLPYRGSYDLVIDRENVDNLRMIEKYNIQLQKDKRRI